MLNDLELTGRSRTHVTQFDSPRFAAQREVGLAFLAMREDGRIQIRSATPVDSMNEGGMLRAVDQQLSVHSKR